MNGIILSVDPRTLAHCGICYEPMYYIYDQKLRSYCYECTLEHRVQQGLSYEQDIPSAESVY